MTDEELKKKIEDILEEYNFETDDGEGWVLSTDEMADALIASEIGDVKDVEAEANRYEMLYKLQNRDMALAERRAHDAEHRAEVAEKALKEFAGYVGCERCPYSYQCELPCVDSSNDYRACFETYVKEAEKELAEEGKNHD